MEKPVITYEQRGDVALIRMDDGKANALSQELLDQLAAAFDRAEKEAKAVVLAGRPDRFSGGFDMRAMMAGPAAARAIVTAGGALMMRIYELPKPVVMACTGHAIAGGVLFVACGDTRIGARGAYKIGLNEVSNGMPVPILAHELARDRLDPRELVAATVQAKIYDPEGALRAGWLDRLVEPGEVEAAAIEEAERLAKLPATAYAMTKRSLRRRTIAYIRETVESNMREFTG